MKKLFILLAIMSMTILTGCVDVDLTLDIEKNGDSKISAKILGESFMMTQVDENELLEVYDDVQIVNEGSKTGYVLTTEIDKEAFANQEVDLSEHLDMSKDSGLFTHTYTVDFNIKDVMFKDMTSEDKSMIYMIGNSVPLKFHIKSPIKFEESNATSIEEIDGKTVYNWDYTLATLDNINAKVKVPNITGIAVAIIAIVGIAAFVILKNKKASQDSNEV